MLGKKCIVAKIACDTKPVLYSNIVMIWIAIHRSILTFIPRILPIKWKKLRKVGIRHMSGTFTSQKPCHTDHLGPCLIFKTNIIYETFILTRHSYVQGTAIYRQKR